MMGPRRRCYLWRRGLRVYVLLEYFVACQECEMVDCSTVAARSELFDASSKLLCLLLLPLLNPSA